MTIIDSQFYIIDSLSLFHCHEMLTWWLPGCNGWNPFLSSNFGSACAYVIHMFSIIIVCCCFHWVGGEVVGSSFYGVCFVSFLI